MPSRWYIKNRPKAGFSPKGHWRSWMFHPFFPSFSHRIPHRNSKVCGLQGRLCAGRVIGDQRWCAGDGTYGPCGLLGMPTPLKYGDNGWEIYGKSMGNRWKMMENDVFGIANIWQMLFSDLSLHVVVSQWKTGARAFFEWIPVTEWHDEICRHEMWTQHWAPRNGIVQYQKRPNMSAPMSRHIPKRLERATKLHMSMGKPHGKTIPRLATNVCMGLLISIDFRKEESNIK